MEIDLNTFLTTWYCAVDDVYRGAFAPTKPVRPGHQPEMADSGSPAEVCVGAAQVRFTAVSVT